ncbi:MAG: OmpA family protein [Hyphomicrobiaceae bacterium]
MKCNPWRWLFGVIPLLILAAFAIIKEKSPIEAELTARTQAALKKGGMEWASVRFDARDGYITGKAIEEAQPPKATALVYNEWGVRNAINNAALIDKVDKYAWTAMRRDKTIRLNGLVPNEKMRRDIIGRVRATFAGHEVDDKMEYARSDIPADTWLGGVDFSLKQLALLKQGQVDLERTSLTVTGEANDVAAYRNVRTALEKNLPKGVNLKQEAVKPPVVKPYVWTARHDDKQLTLGGHVPTEKMRAEILEDAKRAFPKLTINDRMEPGDGAPNNFGGVVRSILAQLAKLVEGTAEVKDTGVTVSGLADTAAIADATRAGLKQGVAQPYRLAEQIKHREPLIKTVSPYVTAAAVTAGDVVLTGFVPSDEARQALVGAARQRFAPRTVRDQLEIGAGQPPGWQRCLETSFGALQRLGNGRAELLDRRLSLTGVTEVEDLAQSLPGSVRDGVGGGCDTDVRITLNIENKIRAEEEARRLAAAEAEARRRAEEEARARAAMDADARRKADEEARLRAAADAEARRKADEEARARAAATQAAAQAQAEEARRKAEAEARQRAEAEARQRAQAATVCVEAVRTLAREGVLLFDTARATIAQQSYPTLNRIAETANRCPEVRIEVQGHTDSEGAPDRNQRLSERRAQAVVDYLVRAGVRPERLAAVGLGQDRPVAPNDTPENKARNRRIEFTVKNN